MGRDPLGKDDNGEAERRAKATDKINSVLEAHRRQNEQKQGKIINFMGY